MQSELEKGEPVPDGVRRIAVGHADAALSALADPRSIGTLTETIHEVRKSVKRARSALLLLRPALGGKRWRKLDRRFGKAATCLSAPRDAGAAIETLDVLAEHYIDVLKPEPFAEVRAHLVEQNERALWRALERDGLLALATHRLERARSKLMSARTSWEDEEPLWAAPVRRTYKRAREGMRGALDGGSPEPFHEWRKETKHLRHHLALLEGAWGRHLDRASLLIHELSDLLGEHHDLATFGARLRDTPAMRTTALRRAEWRAVLGLIEGRSREIEEDAAAVGARIFARKPDEVVERLLSLWNVWHVEL